MEMLDNKKGKTVLTQVADGLLIGLGIALPGVMAFLSLLVAPAGFIFFGLITIAGVLTLLMGDGTKKRIFLGVIIVPILWFLFRIFIF